MYSVAALESKIPDFLKSLFVLPADENATSWIYRHRQSFEKILCTLYRHDKFPDGQDAAIKTEIEKLISLLEIIAPTHTVYPIGQLTRARKKLHKAITENRPESATPLQSRQKQAKNTLFNCRRMVTRFIHGLADIFSATASARNIHNLLNQENVNKTLYALAGIFAALKVGMMVISSARHVCGEDASDQEKSASSWRMRLNDQARRRVFPVTRDVVWAMVRFLCIAALMDRYREYCTLGLFGFAVALKIMESYQNACFYAQLQDKVLEQKKSVPVTPDDEVSMLTARKEIVNGSIADIPSQTSVNVTEMLTFLSVALHASKREVMQQDMLQVMIWASYTAGAALCLSNAGVARAMGGAWILLTCVLQVTWETKKTDITKLKPRDGFFKVNASNDLDVDPVSSDRFVV